MKYHLTPVRRGFIKRQEITSADKDVEKREPLCTVNANVNWCSHHGKQYRGASKIKNRTITKKEKRKTTIQLSNFTSGY